MKLRRHQLAYPSKTGWRHLVNLPMDEHVSRHLQEWAQRRLPLVVTRQDAVESTGEIAIGWPAPPQWGHSRVALQVPAKCVGWFDEFPYASDACRLLPRNTRSVIETLLRALGRLRIRPRVYGSYGWQLLSGFGYVHGASDLDLWLPVGSLEHADGAVSLLKDCVPQDLRIDGELLFPDGAGVAWREYAAWRAGRTGGLLVKRIDSVSVDHELTLPHWCEPLVA